MRPGQLPHDRQQVRPAEDVSPRRGDTNPNLFGRRNKYKVADAIVFHGEGLADPRLLGELETLRAFRLEARAAGNRAPLFVYFMKEPPHVGNRLNHSVGVGPSRPGRGQRTRV